MLEELLRNALLHRDYHIDTPTRLFLFDDRLEIISPGVLSGGLTVAHILSGRRHVRNPLLTSFALKGLLPHPIGQTGIYRVLRKFPAVEFFDDTEVSAFRVVVKRANRPSRRRLE